MNAFIHVPQHLKTNRILPGHGRAARRYTAATSDVDRSEGVARRSNWTNVQAQRRRAYGRGGSIGLVGAVLVLMMTVFAAIGPDANVLDRSTDAPTVHLVDAVPVSPTAASRPS